MNGPVPERDERGFILVGVVMFMIALTILGLSLFALSSYEAQFFYASQSREQSLQNSESGMEVVKALLSDASVPSAYRFRLEAAQLAVGEFGISRALAYQQNSPDPRDTTSKGLVNWDDSLVIVVSARVGGEERTVQARYVPASNKNPYHQLITSGRPIVYYAKNGTSRTLELTGKVWQRVQTGADSAWTAAVNWPFGRPVDPTQPATPLANAFVDQKLPLCLGDDGTNYDHDSGKSFVRFFNSSSDPEKYYHVLTSTQFNTDPQYPLYGFYSPYDLHLKIHGTVIWVANDGAHFKDRVTVTMDSQGSPVISTLIIVAKRGHDPTNPTRALWFEGGLSVSDTSMVKVFLVSEDDIAIDQINSSGSSLDARSVSIVTAGAVELMGPDSGEITRLGHGVSMDAVADNAIARGWLPQTTGGTGTTFRFAKYSWLETRLP